jgi:hypothetical protein
MRYGSGTDDLQLIRPRAICLCAVNNPDAREKGVLWRYSWSPTDYVNDYRWDWLGQYEHILACGVKVICHRATATGPLRFPQNAPYNSPTRGKLSDLTVVAHGPEAVDITYLPVRQGIVVIEGDFRTSWAAEAWHLTADDMCQVTNDLDRAWSHSLKETPTRDLPSKFPDVTVYGLVLKDKRYLPGSCRKNDSGPKDLRYYRYWSRYRRERIREGLPPRLKDIPFELSFLPLEQVPADLCLCSAMR